MSRLLGWLKNASVRVLDPNREERIGSFADEVWQQLKVRGKAFDFRRAMSELGADVEDNLLVAERVYEKALAKAWQDTVITNRERDSLAALAGVVSLPAERARQCERRYGLALFESALGAALSDGHLGPPEVQTLGNIAAGMRTTTRQLVQHYFHEQGEGFLRNLFAVAMQGGQFTPRHWQELIATANGLGLTEHDLKEAVRPQAQVYVEHVLADAKSDGRISDVERRSLQWLLDTFSLPVGFTAYVRGEMAKLDVLTDIARGRLPSLVVPGVALRAGEIVHHQCAAAYAQVRNLQSGPRVQRHDGQVTITDSRLVFSSPTKSFDLNHRRVVSLLRMHEGVELRVSGTGTGYYYFGGDPNLAAAIYEVAVGRANQTIVEVVEGAPTRHIPRDVRQRVWQRYGGRCADCGATQYLEFDHVVPVAKGGSNSDVNVQLLCRRCNAKKSDHI